MGHKPGHRGLWKHKQHSGDADVKLADFSYQNDELAKMIVRAWTDPAFRDGLVGDATNVSISTRMNNARLALQNLLPPIGLTSPVVLTEAEYDDGWEMEDDNQVVFVLPNATRQAGNLLESAKLLMACVPNGI